MVTKKDLHDQLDVITSELNKLRKKGESLIKLKSTILAIILGRNNDQILNSLPKHVKYALGRNGIDSDIKLILFADGDEYVAADFRKKFPFISKEDYSSCNSRYERLSLVNRLGKKGVEMTLNPLNSVLDEAKLKDVNLYIHSVYTRMLDDEKKIHRIQSDIQLYDKRIVYSLGSKVSYMLNQLGVKNDFAFYEFLNGKEPIEKNNFIDIPAFKKASSPYERLLCIKTIGPLKANLILETISRLYREDL